jgi:Ca-activated chloride channel family protein
MKKSWAGPFVALAFLSFSPASAQDNDDDDQLLGDIIVTAAVRQGGAQDIRHFRQTAATGMPRPEMLTVEGLMGEHDLTIRPTKPCAQMFCLVTDSMHAHLPLRPQDRLFVGLAFATNIDEKLYRRPPLNLVAVVDKSGSMSGEPLELVRKSLRQIVGQMQDDDQLSIVLYGDRSHVWMGPKSIKGNRKAILAKIDGIESAGSTNMEEGLKVGYQTAFSSQGSFKGQTRLMLFTDENPNVGDTSAEGFMGMARAASDRDVGLTTIGVGHIFDDQLATRLSSVRGGNQFFIDSAETVTDVFTRQFDMMGGELAHDLTITIKPAEGWAATGVFGVPDGLMTSGQDSAITVTVPTVFLSTNGGGIYVTLGKASDRTDLPSAPLSLAEPLMDVSLSYREARSKKVGTDAVKVAAPTQQASAPLRLAQSLVDQFLAMREATTAYHISHEPKRAFTLLSELQSRMASSGLSDLKSEIKLVGQMRGEAAYYSGYSSELPRNIRHKGITGRWMVVSADGFSDIRRGDFMSFDDDGTVTTQRNGKAHGEAQEGESFEVSESELFLRQSDIVLNWVLKGDRLTLKDTEIGSSARIDLKRQPEGASSQ